MKKVLGSFMLAMLLITAAGCSDKDDNAADNKEKKSDQLVELTVSAAASLQDALTDIKKTYEKEHEDVKLQYNFGASGALQQQISKGAPVDLFFSAAEDKFDTLVDEGKINPKDGKDLLGNSLVMVVPENSNLAGLEDLGKADKVSLGTPDSVPAGEYGQETLVNMNLWNSVKDKVVYAKDVRQVLTYVETGNVDAGMVYKTDALTSDKVKIADTAAEKTHTPIIYPAGVVKDSEHSEEAKEFYDYLQGEEAMKIFEEYGFTSLD